MSIRLRFTLFYNAILAVTLAVFGLALYYIQASTTYDAIRNDLKKTSDGLAMSGSAILNDPKTSPKPPDGQSLPDGQNPPPPKPFNEFAGGQGFPVVPEREIVRVLDTQGNLLASPFGRSEDALPLSAAGLAAVQNGQDWWETENVQDQRLLIYSRPVLAEGKFTYILQSARPLDERDRSLQFLASTFTIASLLTILLAFGIGWILSGLTLQPINRLTQTARTIGQERDFTRRVAYKGPQDEVGRLATTFNSMLSQLQDAYQKVAHSLEMQRDFVADVSHELRTPLTTLRGNLGLLRRQPPVPREEREDILKDMTDESDRLMRLVNDLLVLARADAGRELSRTAVKIQPLLEETVSRMQKPDPLREIALETGDLTVQGDEDALKQVLLIGLDNALKHCAGRIDVSARAADGGVEIVIADCGPGIPAEQLEHIFDRFYRGEEAAGTPGFGLGLPIARSLVEGMGGQIRMESQPGEGSRLVLIFVV